MARARSLLRAAALTLTDPDGAPPPPSRLAAVLNEELCKNNPTGMFITLIIGFLVASTGKLRFANAGHVRPMRLAPTGVVTAVVTRPNPPLGLLPGVSHVDHGIDLERGETLVRFTDGLPEMVGPAGAFYTDERVVADLAALAGASPERVATTLAGNVETFAAGHPAYDDVTLLIVRRG